jgi:MarR family transcriptional regulator, organic hydroperoxide resistance regulator
MDFEESVSFLLAKVSTAYRNSLERSMDEIGLHGGQVFVLFELWRQDGLRQVDLAERLGLSPPTVNKTVKGLIESGFVTRDRVEDDARSTRIFLTQEGTAIRDAIEEQWHDLEEETLANLTTTERLVLAELLKKLRESY